MDIEPFDWNDLPYIILILYLPELPAGCALLILPRLKTVGFLRQRTVHTDVQCSLTHPQQF